MIPRARLWHLVRIAILASGLVILFFSGVFPIEDLFSVTPGSLTASIAASDVASLTNEQRILNGQPPLAISPLLTEAAQLKADDMAKYSYYAHTGPDGKTMLDWMNEVGYRYLNAGENLVIDRTSAQSAVDAWMNSPDHRANILRPQFTQIGVGVAQGEYEGLSTIFVVQEFGTPYPASVAATPPKSAEHPVSAAVTTPVTTAPAATPAVPATVPAQPASLATLPKPIVVQQVEKLAEPLVSTATAKPSAVIAHPQTAATTSAPVASSSPRAAVQEGQGSSTIAYALSPGFFAPVTMTASQAVPSGEAPPQAESATRLSVWIGEVRAFFIHIFHIGA